jgi:hypothetical protein
MKILYITAIILLIAVMLFWITIVIGDRLGRKK